MLLVELGGEALENKKLLVVFTELYDMCGLSIAIDSSIVDQVKTILKEHKISTSGLFWYEKGELAVPYKD